MSTAKKDLLISIGLLLLGLGAVYVIQTTPKAGKSMTDALTFSTLPTIYAGCLALLSLALASFSVGKILKERGKHEERKAGWNGLVVFRLISTLLLVCAYVFSLQHTHYAAATAGFLFLTLVLYGRGPIWKVATISLVGAALLHMLFIEIIQLPI